jgi:hypothetical protein
MNKTIRNGASALGVYASLLGIEHGIFELLQGRVEPENLLINAVGPPCQPEAVWHACLPAITLLPNLLISGLLTIFVSLLVGIWAAGFCQRKHGGWILIALSILMVPVGGGFVPAFIGVIAGILGTRIHASLHWWKTRPLGVVTVLARMWPWNFVILALWFPGSWLLGYWFGDFLLDLGLLLFFGFDIGLPILIALSAIATDSLEEPAD